MNAVTTMTIDVPADLEEKLGRLAEGTRRSRAAVAAEAMSAYVEHELAVLDGIARGLADAAAGRITPHDEAMDRVDAMIAEVRTKAG